MSNPIFKRLELNVVSIVIGALVFIVIRVWCETIMDTSDSVHKRHHPKCNELKKMTITSILITLFIIFIIIVIYTYYKQKGWW